MKKFFVILAALILCVSFTACGNSSAGTNNQVSVATMPDLTGNWKIDNCAFPDGTSLSGDNLTEMDVRFQGLSYVIDYPEFDFSSDEDTLKYLGSYKDKYFVYDSSKDGTDAFVYYDGILYMYVELRDTSNNLVMGYDIFVREGENGLGTLTTGDVQTLFTMMNTAIETVRKAVK